MSKLNKLMNYSDDDLEGEKLLKSIVLIHEEIKGIYS